MSRTNSSKWIFSLPSPLRLACWGLRTNSCILSSMLGVINGSLKVAVGHFLVLVYILFHSYGEEIAFARKDWLKHISQLDWIYSSIRLSDNSLPCQRDWAIKLSFPWHNVSIRGPLIINIHMCRGTSLFSRRGSSVRAIPSPGRFVE